MKVRAFHRWDVTPREAVQIQKELRSRVVATGTVRPKLVAGADLAYDKQSDAAWVAVVVFRFPSLEIVETLVRRDRVTFPYVPGLLSFREAPVLLRAFERIEHRPDVIFVDGHGRSHPRQAGIACHVGLLLNRPVIGCAKSLLTGTYREPGLRRGSVSDLVDQDGAVIGAALRTRDRVKPVFISVGHRIGLTVAIRLTLACAPTYRVPEPTRMADILAERAKRERRQ